MISSRPRWPNWLDRAGWKCLTEGQGDLAATDDRSALEDHIAEQMTACGLSLTAGRSPAEIAERLIEKRRLAAVELPPSALEALRNFLQIRVPLDSSAEVLSAFAEGAGLTLEQGLEGLQRRAAEIAGIGLAPGEIRYDAAFGRPLDYYTGLVFAISAGKADRPLAAGGRYDRLLTMLGSKEPIPGVGFSVWIDRVDALADAS